ncbi:MAG: hypothetical protein EBU32_12955 [Opitutaceae bacterium]|nr:hypothetical protein [Opitutaceae bacterium]
MVAGVGKIGKAARGGPFLAGLAPQFGKNWCSYEASEHEKKSGGTDCEIAAKNRAEHGHV